MLPEKWCVLRDNNNYKEINDYFNTGTESNHYECKVDYMHYPNYSDYIGFKVGQHSSGMVRRGYTVISFEQFKQYVLNKNENNEKEYSIF